MTEPAFLDTNVLLRHILNDNPDHSPRASRLMRRIKAGEVTAHTNGTVMFETVYVLEKQFGAPKDRIAAILGAIAEFPGLVLPNRESVLAALDFWKDQGPLSFADCFHLAFADQLGLGRIYTFDLKIDRYPGVERIEP